VNEAWPTSEALIAPSSLLLLLVGTHLQDNLLLLRSSVCHLKLHF
jgi:hypothetical protein